MEKEEEERAAADASGLEWAADASLEAMLALVDAADEAELHHDLLVLARHLAAAIARRQRSAHPLTADLLGQALNAACKASSAGNRYLNSVRVLENTLGKVRETTATTSSLSSSSCSELEERLVAKVVREIGDRSRETLRLIDDDLLPCVPPGAHRARLICLSWRTSVLRVMWYNRCLDDKAVLLAAHQQALTVSWELSPTDPLRLRAALHLSVVFKDQMGDTASARMVLQYAVDLARRWSSIYPLEPGGQASHWAEIVQDNLDILSGRASSSSEPRGTESDALADPTK